MQEPLNKKQTFQPLGDGLARKGKRIYLRAKVNQRYTWLSTKTNVPSLARQWKDRWEKRQWARTNGLLPAEEPIRQAGRTTFNQLVDLYEQAGRPIVRKRAFRPKAPRSIRNESYYSRPVREYFGRQPAPQITLADCDLYYAWRTSGGYVSKFKVRDKEFVRRSRGGSRIVDLELGFASNVFAYAVRRGLLKANPFTGRGRFSDESQVRHCREVSPTPQGLEQIVQWMVKNGLQQDADLTRFLAYSGLRVGEALMLRWSQVDREQELIHVKRSKKGVFPFVLILPEMAGLLNDMRQRATGEMMFPAPFAPGKPRDYSSYRRRLEVAARRCGLSHVTPHGLRSYFVTQARQSGLTDAEIAQLIGDKTGPTLIAEVYGDVRPDHLLAVARKIQLTARTRAGGATSQPDPNPTQNE